MEEEEEISSPFWLQSSSNFSRGSRHGSSFLLNSSVLLGILLVLALAFLFIIIPSFLSFTSQIFKPQSVKKSWDSLNLVLVLFAIVCGFLSRNNNSSSSTSSAAIRTSTSTYEEEDHRYKFSEGSESFQKPNPVNPRRFWYDHHDQYNSSDVINNNGYGTLNRLRSFSSHPDLRQEETSWGINSRDDHQWRFYDDTHLYNNSYSSSSSDYYYHLHHPQQQQWRRPEQKLEAGAEKERAKEENVKEKESENNAVDEGKKKGVDDDATPVVESQKEIIYTPRSPSQLLPPRSPSPTLLPPPPPQANKLVRRKVVKRTNQDRGGKRDRKSEQHQSSTSQPLQHPPSPPPEPVVKEASGKNEKKRGGATSATKEFLTSLRRNKKKKKQRQKSVENLDSFFNYESSYPLPPSTIPPPPPPPPPPFFHNLFSSKKRKAKKIHSVIPTPPPPPPRTQKFSIISASQSKVESKNLSFATQKPSLPVKIKSYRNNVEENVSRGNESPLNAIPPPPPLPPFKMPAWKYEVHGDFVRLKSNIGDDAEKSSSPSDAGGDGGDSTMSPLFCPSPDVNTKADNFIARFRAGLRLEKMNSVTGRSNLGPETSPS